MCVVFIQVFKLNPEHCCLKFIESAVEPIKSVVILFYLPVDSEVIEIMSGALIIGNHHPGIAISIKVFYYPTAKAPYMPKASDLAGFVFGSMSVGTVFD